MAPVAVAGPSPPHDFGEHHLDSKNKPLDCKQRITTATEKYLVLCAMVFYLCNTPHHYSSKTKLMKHATLHWLIGLALLSAASIASAAPKPQTVSRGPVAFDHGIPVFVLPAVEVTPGPGAADSSHRVGHGMASDDTTPAESRRGRGTAGYTPMRVVAR